MRFEGRVALITAAASGIGRATADIICAEGGTVAAVDSDEGRLKDAVAAIQAAGGRAHAYRADALDATQVNEVVERVVREHGHVDILVNAVGGSTIVSRPAATVDELSLAEWQQILTFNLEGTFLFIHALVPVMKRQRGGKIVNISSIAGRGISASSKKLGQELGPFGITVNAIAPSMTLTERIRPRWEQRSAEEQAQEIFRTPLRRMAEARDQARVICFLASSDADFVTGVTIDVTGGI